MSIVEFLLRPVVKGLIRLFAGPQLQPPKFYTGGFVSDAGLRADEFQVVLPLPPTWQPLPEHNEYVDIEVVIADAMARWYGDAMDRRPLARAIADAVEHYLPAAPEEESVRERFDRGSG